MVEPYAARAEVALSLAPGRHGLALAGDRDLAAVAVHLVEPVPVLVVGPAGGIGQPLSRAPRLAEIGRGAVPHVPPAVALGHEPHASAVVPLADGGGEGRVDAGP